MIWTITLIDQNKAEIEALTIAKAEALEKAEAEKNAKLKALDEQRAKEEKDLEKQRLQTQYNAQVDAFNATKATKMAETVASGIASAAQAFAALAPIPFVGVALVRRPLRSLRPQWGCALHKLKSKNR